MVYWAMVSMEHGRGAQKPSGSAARFEPLVRVLTPYLGAHMARAAVGVHTENLAAGGRSLTETEIESLLERLARGLAVFVGRDKTNQILVEARAVLRAQNGS